MIENDFQKNCQFAETCLQATANLVLILRFEIQQENQNKEPFCISDYKTGLALLKWLSTKRNGRLKRRFTSCTVYAMHDQYFFGDAFFSFVKQSVGLHSVKQVGNKCFSEFQKIKHISASYLCNHHERFHRKRANISARYNDWKFVAIFGQDVPIPFLTVPSPLCVRSHNQH